MSYALKYVNTVSHVKKYIPVHIFLNIQSHIIQTGWLEIWFLIVHVIKEDILISIKKRKEKSVKILPGWQI